MTEHRRSDRICIWIAWLQPKRLAYWVYIRVHSYATTHKYSDTHPDDVTWSMALKEFAP